MARRRLPPAGLRSRVERVGARSCPRCSDRGADDASRSDPGGCRRKRVAGGRPERIARLVSGSTAPGHRRLRAPSPPSHRFHRALPIPRFPSNRCPASLPAVPLSRQAGQRDCRRGHHRWRRHTTRHPHAASRPQGPTRRGVWGACSSHPFPPPAVPAGGLVRPDGCRPVRCCPDGAVLRPGPSRAAQPAVRRTPCSKAIPRAKSRH